MTKSSSFFYLQGHITIPTIQSSNPTITICPMTANKSAMVSFLLDRNNNKWKDQCAKKEHNPRIIELPNATLR
jgi:hypothetical protein